VRLINDIKEPKVIYEHTLSTTPQKIIADSWLKDGITNPLIGIHSFAFYSYRLQDEFVESPRMHEYCKPKGMLGVHFKLDCLLPMPVNEREKLQLEINYIGGIIASLKLHTLTPLSERTQKSLFNDFRGDLNIRKSQLQSQDVYRWTHYRVNITFYNENLNAAIQAALTEQQDTSSFKPLMLMELHPQQMQQIYKEAGQQP